MGLLDFFKKKTASSRSETPQISEQVQSQSSQRKKTLSIVPIPDMIQFGLEWRDKYISEYAIANNYKVRAEALMYTCWSVWYHCLCNNRVSRDQAYVNQFFAHLMAYLQNEDERFEEVDFFMPLFQNRYGIFKDDIKGLAESHYPRTKQYLPIRTYKAFCVDQLKIVHLSELTMEQDDEMMDFVSKFIRFTNEMNKTIMITF